MNKSQKNILMKQNLSVDLKTNLDYVMFILFKKIKIISKEFSTLKNLLL